MGKYAFMSQKAEKIAGRIEQSLRKEVGAREPLSYAIENGRVGTASVGSLFGDIGIALLGGGNANLLYKLNFQLPQPRLAYLQASVYRQGFGAYVGLLIYSTKLGKSVSGEITLDQPETNNSADFIGDWETCAKLNGDKAFLRRINSLARTTSQMGNFTLRIRRYCRIAPHPDGSSVFTVGTLPRSTWFGFDSTADSKMFFEMADTIESLL